MTSMTSPFSGMSPSERRRVSTARVGRLATVRPDGRPHLVVVTFALLDADVLVTAVDAKPKHTTNLQRLRNIAATPWASLLVDHYGEDWDGLWWVRLDCSAAVVSEEPRRTELAAPLVGKYAQYRERPPRGPVIVLGVERSVSWSAGAEGT